LVIKVVSKSSKLEDSEFNNSIYYVLGGLKTL
jgi:hypothetical protein